MIKIKRPVCSHPKSLSEQSTYKHTENKRALIQASFSKCMYCESFIPHISFGDVEHIKSKNKFPSLEFSWDNLGIVCSKCNNEKKTSITIIHHI